MRTSFQIHISSIAFYSGIGNPPRQDESIKSVPVPGKKIDWIGTIIIGRST
jgi:hypothetical protein